MKRHGSSSLTACLMDGGVGLSASQDAFAYGRRLIARGRAGASLDYGAKRIVAAAARQRLDANRGATPTAVKRNTLHSLLDVKF